MFPSVFVAVLKITKENSRIQIQIPGSVPKCRGFATLLLYSAIYSSGIRYGYFFYDDIL
jgi:hypothetical protein